MSVVVVDAGIDHVVGVDPDRDWITLAVLDARNAGVVDTERAWVIEGSAASGSASPEPTTAYGKRSAYTP